LRGFFKQQSTEVGDKSMTDEKEPTKREARRTLEALRISATLPSADEMAFLAREFVLCTLPHRNPGDVPAWSRRNGNLTLAIQPGWNHRTNQSCGYPYGSIPRLLLAWITTEALRTKSRRLELGDSLGAFMMALGLSPYTGRGPRGDATRLRDQMERLFGALISFDYCTTNETDKRRGGHAWLRMQVAPRGRFWWNEEDRDEVLLWGSWIELGEAFFEAITSEPVPLDVRILRHIKQSPMAIDLYAILNREAFRARKSGEPRFLAWEWLHIQIGNEYGKLDNFRRDALPQLETILAVYPGLTVQLQKAHRGQQSGLWVSNLSVPSIAPEQGDNPGEK
jgi:hypothetical protein